MRVETWPIDRLRSYEGNPRVHDEEAIGLVAESVRRYGFQQPIVVDREGVIVAGHARYEAARRLGVREVPVHVMDASASDVAEYRLVDNLVADALRWDYDRLVEVVVGLEDDLRGFLDIVDDVEEQVERVEQRERQACRRREERVSEYYWSGVVVVWDQDTYQEFAEKFGLPTEGPPVRSFVFDGERATEVEW